ncbi:ion transporter [Pontibacter sp. G13]|uniref:ion transporter n=1 Tax=Pontibacter sp. G13 TaxID=3074898 RepID=UPI00288BC843|nr:ion transporter [Pontibacter sp. G13]WNJ20774.1 ion transporter [Pontibacter sp. G13]
MNRLWIRFFTAERTVAWVIILNAITLFLLSFNEWQDVMLLEAIDAACLVYFLMEAVLKIKLQGWERYWGDGWNRFDFVILIFTIPSLLLLFRTEFLNLGIIFVFRIVRVLRFFKFIRFIPDIHELAAGIKRAFKASIFVVLAFFSFSFIISLISCRLFQDIAPHMFGDPVSSFYQIFKVFTIEGWYEIPEQIIRYGRLGEVESFFTKLYFILIVMAGGMFGLSIVNAIFVEEMVRDNNDELEAQVTRIERKLDELIDQQRQKADELDSNPAETAESLEKKGDI